HGSFPPSREVVVSVSAKLQIVNCKFAIENFQFAICNHHPPLTTHHSPATSCTRNALGLQLTIMRLSLLSFRWLVSLTVGALLVGAGSLWCYHITRPDYRLRQGQEAIGRDDPDKAIRLAERLRSSGHPDHAHLLRGQAYLRLRRINRAIQEYNQIRPDDEPILVEASLVYGLGFLSLGKQAEAEKLLLLV